MLPGGRTKCHMMAWQRVSLLYSKQSPMKDSEAADIYRTIGAFQILGSTRTSSKHPESYGLFVMPRSGKHESR